MMQKPEQNNPASYGYNIAQTRVWPKLLAIAVIIIAVTIAVWNLPQGYNTDLTLIGKGKPAAVQVFDSNSSHSLELMDAVNHLRGDYKGRIEFLLADLNSEAGRSFAAAQSVSPPALILFGPDGTRLTVVGAKQDADTLKKIFTETFHF
jgi:hypothetical protein